MEFAVARAAATAAAASGWQCGQGEMFKPQPLQLRQIVSLGIVLGLDRDVEGALCIPRGIPCTTLASDYRPSSDT